MEYVYYSFTALILVIVYVIFSRRKDLHRVDLDIKKMKIGFELSSEIAEKIISENKTENIQNKTLTKVLPSKLAASVVQLGGSGSRIYTRTVWSEEEHAYLEPDGCISVSFPSNPELMWVSCCDGYKIVSSTSSTKNDLYHLEQDEQLCGLILKDQLKNEITIHCRKK